MIYLASPYTSPEASIREIRYLKAEQCLAHLLMCRLWTYSPIVHCHHMALVYKMPTDFEFWLKYNHAMIDVCDTVMVLMLDCWKENKGVADEIAYAKTTGKTLSYIEPSTYMITASVDR